jgi:hypothetical protein
MIFRPCVFCVLAVGGFVNFVQAQPVHGCPDGQAVNSLNPNGTPVQCIPVPPLVNLAPLELAIVQETTERKQADAEIRASINEASIVGRYAFSGTQACFNSSRGFNADLTPVMPPLAAPPLPGQPGQPTPITFVSQGASTVTGFRTFNADRTGTLELNAINLGFPGIVYTNFNGNIGASVSSGVPNASTSTQAGTFQWDIVDGRLIIDDNAGTAGGTVTSGGNRVGWSVTIRDLPRQVGVLGKDLKTITVTNEAPGVEVSVLSSPPGEPLQVLETPRICVRDRVLRKL